MFADYAIAIPSKLRKKEKCGLLISLVYVPIAKNTQSPVNHMIKEPFIG